MLTTPQRKAPDRSSGPGRDVRRLTHDIPFFEFKARLELMQRATADDPLQLLKSPTGANRGAIKRMVAWYQNQVLHALKSFECQGILLVVMAALLLLWGVHYD